jgi:hypothetical protein
VNPIDELLESICKNVIKTILSCLDQATKGTIYRIGPMPDLQAVRVTSGIRLEEGDGIEWGLPSVSDYNRPGKKWTEYRDRLNQPLEAMGWCVEKQQSWTADNPAEDVRSVRKQLLGELEDVYHMEPVLVRKVDLLGSCLGTLAYPVDAWGEPIWQDSEYVVVAVIKIHFLPNTLHREDRSTRIIKELSRSLGTELLTLHLRETLSRSLQEFAQQRLQSCKILAHELRNTLIKFGFIFAAINAEIGILRTEWEAQLREAFPDLEWKGPILERLGELLSLGLPDIQDDPEWSQLGTRLLAEMEELAASPLLPTQGEQWLKNKIVPKWGRLLTVASAWDAHKDEINGLLSRLKVALHVGLTQDLARNINHLQRDLCDRWIRLAYIYCSSNNLFVLDEIIDLLENPVLPIPHKSQMRKVLKYLKVLVEALPEVEERANKIILSLRYGNGDALEAEAHGRLGFPEECEFRPYGGGEEGMSSFSE